MFSFLIYLPCVSKLPRVSPLWKDSKALFLAGKQSSRNIPVIHPLIHKQSIFYIYLHLIGKDFNFAQLVFHLDWSRRYYLLAFFLVFLIFLVFSLECLSTTRLRLPRLMRPSLVPSPGSLLSVELVDWLTYNPDLRVINE